MPQIPLDNYGQATAVPRLNPIRVSMPDSSGIARGAQALASAFGNIANQAERKIAHDRQEAEELARVKAANVAMEDEVHTKAVVSDIEARIADGSLDWREAVEHYDTVQREREYKPIADLPPDGIERFNGALHGNRQAGLYAVKNVVAGARRTEFRGQFDTALDTLGKMAGEPGADIPKLQARAEGFIPVAAAAGVDEATISAKVQAFKDRTWENQAKARAIAYRDSPEGLAQLEHDLTAEDGFYAGKLDADRRNVLLNQVLNRKDQVERVVREETSRQEAKADRALVEFEQQVSTGVMAPIESMQVWQARVSRGTPEQQERFRELLDDEDELRQVRKMPPVEQQQYVQALKAQQQARGATVHQVNSLRRVETVIEGDLRRLRESPLEHDAILNGTKVQPLDLQALLTGNAGAIRAQLSERMTTLTRMRKQYGPETGNAPLLPQEASTLASMLSEAGTRQTAQIFGLLNRTIGDPGIYNAAMQQIAPGSPVRAYAGKIYAAQRAGGEPDAATPNQGRDREFGDVAMYLLKGESLLSLTKEQRAAGGKASFPMPPAQQFDRRVNDAVGEAFAGRPQDYDTAVQAVRAYYAAKAADEGDVTGQLDGKRLALAVRAVIGDRVRFEGRDVLPPWGMSGDTFSDRADEYVQARLRAAGIADPGNVSLMNVRGRDGTYMLVRGMAPLMDHNHMPLVIRIGGPR